MRWSPSGNGGIPGFWICIYRVFMEGPVPVRQKRPKSRTWDSRICPGSYVDRLTPPPGHQPRIDRTLQCLAGMTISDDTRFLVRFATTSAPSQCENGIFSGVVSCRMRKILNQPPKRHIADSAELAGLRAMRSVVSECDSDNGRRQIAVSSH